jgi:hypothetical protein
MAVLLPMLLWAQVAFAHPQQGEAKGFLTGFSHPISGLDHVLAMVAVGLWGAQLGSPAIWLLPVAFPMVMAFGGMMGLMVLCTDQRMREVRRGPRVWQHRTVRRRPELSTLTIPPSGVETHYCSSRESCRPSIA